MMVQGSCQYIVALQDGDWRREGSDASIVSGTGGGSVLS